MTEALGVGGPRREGGGRRPPPRRGLEAGGTRRSRCSVGLARCGRVAVAVLALLSAGAVALPAPLSSLTTWYPEDGDAGEGFSTALWADGAVVVSHPGGRLYRLSPSPPALLSEGFLPPGDPTFFGFALHGLLFYFTASSTAFVLDASTLLEVGRHDLSADIPAGWMGSARVDDGGSLALSAAYLTGRGSLVRFVFEADGTPVANGTAALGGGGDPAPLYVDRVHGRRLVAVSSVGERTGARVHAFDENPLRESAHEDLFPGVTWPFAVGGPVDGHTVQFLVFSTNGTTFVRATDLLSIDQKALPAGYTQSEVACFDAARLSGFVLVEGEGGGRWVQYDMLLGTHVTLVGAGLPAAAPGRRHSCVVDAAHDTLLVHFAYTAADNRSVVAAIPFAPLTPTLRLPTTVI